RNHRAVAGVDVSLDLPEILPRAHAALILRSVDSHVARQLGKLAIGSLRRLAVPAILVLEDDVVHLPELALLAGAPRRQMRIARVPMHRQREIDETKADDARVDEPSSDVGLGECRKAAASRALEVRVLDDLRARAVAPEHVTLIRNVCDR